MLTAERSANSFNFQRAIDELTLIISEEKVYNEQFIEKASTKKFSVLQDSRWRTT